MSHTRKIDYFLLFNTSSCMKLQRRFEVLPQKKMASQSDKNRTPFWKMLIERVRIIQAFEQNACLKEVAELFDTSWPRVKCIMGHRKAIMELYKSSNDPNIVKFRKIDFLNICLFEYIQRVKIHHIHRIDINVTLIYNIAIELQDILKIKSFIPDELWYNNFKASYNISLTRVQILLKYKPATSLDLHHIIEYCKNNEIFYDALDEPEAIIRTRHEKTQLLMKSLYEYIQRAQYNLNMSMNEEHLLKVAQSLSNIIGIEHFNPNKKWFWLFKNQYDFNISQGRIKLFRIPPSSMDFKKIIKYCKENDPKMPIKEDGNGHELKKEKQFDRVENDICLSLLQSTDKLNSVEEVPIEIGKYNENNIIEKSKYETKLKDEVKIKEEVVVVKEEEVEVKQQIKEGEEVKISPTKNNRTENYTIPKTKLIKVKKIPLVSCKTQDEIIAINPKQKAFAQMYAIEGIAEIPPKNNEKSGELNKNKTTNLNLNFETVRKEFVHRNHQELEDENNTINLNSKVKPVEENIQVSLHEKVFVDKFDKHKAFQEKSRIKDSDKICKAMMLNYNFKNIPKSKELNEVSYKLNVFKEEFIEDSVNDREFQFNSNFENFAEPEELYKTKFYGKRKVFQKESGIQNSKKGYKVINLNSNFKNIPEPELNKVINLNGKREAVQQVYRIEDTIKVCKAISLNSNFKLIQESEKLKKPIKTYEKHNKRIKDPEKDKVISLNGELKVGQGLHRLADSIKVCEAIGMNLLNESGIENSKKIPKPELNTVINLNGKREAVQQVYRIEDTIKVRKAISLNSNFKLIQESEKLKKPIKTYEKCNKRIKDPEKDKVISLNGELKVGQGLHRLEDSIKVCEAIGMNLLNEDVINFKADQEEYITKPEKRFLDKEKHITNDNDKQKNYNNESVPVELQEVYSLTEFKSEPLEDDIKPNIYSREFIKQGTKNTLKGDDHRHIVIPEINEVIVSHFEDNLEEFENCKKGRKIINLDSNFKKIPESKELNKVISLKDKRKAVQEVYRIEDTIKVRDTISLNCNFKLIQEPEELNKAKRTYEERDKRLKDLNLLNEDVYIIDDSIKVHGTINSKAGQEESTCRTKPKKTFLMEVANDIDADEYETPLAEEDDKERDKEKQITDDNDRQQNYNIEPLPFELHEVYSLAEFKSEPLEDAIKPNICSLEFIKQDATNTPKGDDQLHIVIPPINKVVVSHFEENLEETSKLLPQEIKCKSDALNILEALKNFAHLKENYLAIGLLSQIENIIQSFLCFRIYKRTNEAETLQNEEMPKQVGTKENVLLVLQTLQVFATKIKQDRFLELVNQLKYSFIHT